LLRAVLFFLMTVLPLASALANDVQTQRVLPVQFNVTSANFKYLFLDGVNLKSSKDSLEPILSYIEPSEATMTRLEPERMRVEFAKPFQFSFYESKNQKFMAEKAVRSFLVKTDKKQADIIMELYRGRYFVGDGSTNEQMQKIVDEAQAYGLDHLIREFHQGRVAPRVLKFESLVFFVQVENLGQPGGSAVQNFGMKTLDYSNVNYLAESEEDYFEDASLNEIQRFIFEDEVPLVEAYLQVILKVMARKQELSERGWLKSVLNSQNGSQDEKTPALTVANSQSMNNVIPLFHQKLSCQQLFQP